TMRMRSVPRLNRELIGDTQRLNLVTNCFYSFQGLGVPSFLDEIIVLELHEQKIMDDIFDDEQWWMQGTIMLGAFMSGVGGSQSGTPKVANRGHPKT
ncbi:hypothetical protein, partial [Psychromonas sp. Urea-02u-13]|uniref:hypothetical protein n=1 Tax=Psychromonas sp. Urea-02u-13 TaxID=2058326 RepID=UPI000CBDBDB7